MPTFLSPRCTGCSTCTLPIENARNLVVCIDGTSNYLGHNRTNVVNLYDKVDVHATGPKQHAYYCSGIGTRARSFQRFSPKESKISDMLDMALARNMKENVKDAYSWLARTYQEGDQIYLFGFSRGAYQARVLAGMIYEIGLIRSPTEQLVDTAYALHERFHSKKSDVVEMIGGFKSMFCWKNMRVHFVGVWDTVSSVGLIRKDIFLSRSSCAEHACHFRHALALDERRVKFMPEYFGELNALADGEKSKYAVPPDEYIAASARELNHEFHEGGTTCISGSKEHAKTPDIKEVWFAGSHSDVGGKSDLKEFHSGNVSLLWMRREASLCGLVFLPTDIVWMPDDLDLGITDSMDTVWRIVEHLPITHQVSFSGAGGNARRPHRQQPRRILPGQKVHASVLYANMYRPQATVGGFDIPIEPARLEVAELDSEYWETGLFDDSAALELLMHLHGEYGVSSIHLDRLMFLLQFSEGKQCIRNVPRWQDLFFSLILNPRCAPLVKLVAIIAYYEASCDPEAHPSSRAIPYNELPAQIFDDARKCLSHILAMHRHRDGSRVIALLGPLTKHMVLRERILTADVLETLMMVLDKIVSFQGNGFGQAMNSLTCLLRCEDTRQFVIERLGENSPNSNYTRLSRILSVDNSSLWAPALRMVLTLARIQEARSVCSSVRPRIMELARKDDQVAGPLAVEILFALYDPCEREGSQLDFRNPRVRANIHTLLLRSDTNRRDSVDGEGREVDPGQQILRRVFGLDAAQLVGGQRRLLSELKKAVQKASSRQRTAATLTLLKLCETNVFRIYLLEINLLSVFVNQLQHKDSALLAAYALVTCLKFGDMKESVKDNELLPKYIVRMIILNYFDDAVGQVEGFQIFGDFMQHVDLREKIKCYKIVEVLSTKLQKGKPEEIRTSLICLDMFHSFDPDGPWIRELVEKSLKYLRDPEWRTQKAGVMILSALVRMEHGVTAICPRVNKIVEMLLLKGSHPVQPESSPPSWMMGPACALRILAQNGKQLLRDQIRATTQYSSLKDLYISGLLVSEVDVSAWQVRTPQRVDVIKALDKVIRAVDELPGGLAPTDAALPHIQHWDRLAGMLGKPAVSVVAILPAILGISAVVILAPIYLSLRAGKFLKGLLSRRSNERLLERSSIQYSTGVAYDVFETEANLGSPSYREGEASLEH